MLGSTAAACACFFLCPILPLWPPCWKPTRVLRETVIERVLSSLYLQIHFLPFLGSPLQSRWLPTENYNSQCPLPLVGLSQREPPGALEGGMVRDTKVLYPDSTLFDLRGLSGHSGDSSSSCSACIPLRTPMAPAPTRFLSSSNATSSLGCSSLRGLVASGFCYSLTCLPYPVCLFSSSNTFVTNDV